MARLPSPLPQVLGLLLLLAALLLEGCASRAHACTSIIVGAGASADGSVLIARSDDGEDVTTTNNVAYHATREGPAVFHSNTNAFSIELPGPGLAYLAMPSISADPSSGRNASLEALGVNSAGVSISATETIYNSAAALAADHYVTHTGLVEDAILSVLLPQATSARRGMEILGAIVESHGTGEGYGVLIADAREAWYMETASGHHWVAHRVPDNSFFVSANQGRFQEVNLSDAQNVLHSPGLEQFAVRARLYNPSRGRPLNFFEAFMDKGPAQSTYSHPRVRELQWLLGGAVAEEAEEGQPPHKIELADVMASLRNHFDGSQHDAYLRQDPDERYRPIAVLRSGNGHISQLRRAGAVPDALSVINWVAWAMPALSPFVPLYKGLTQAMLPRQLTAAGSKPDPVSLFWKARRLEALLFQDWPRLAPPATAAILAFEADVRERQVPAFERRYTLAAGRYAAAAARELQGFTATVVGQACGLLERLTRQAAQGLGLPGVPSDKELFRLLDRAFSAYSFMPPKDEDNVVLIPLGVDTQRAASSHARASTLQKAISTTAVASA